MRALWQLFYTFFKIGAFTFGSGYAMISLIEREVVDRWKWFEREDFLNQFTLAQSAPGPFSLNTAVFTGYRVKGVAGAVAAVLGLVIPSFVIILLIAIYLQDFRDNRVVNAAFQGLRPCVVALIAVPCVRMVLTLKNTWKVTLAAASLALICLTGISPIWLLMGGALVGIGLTFFQKAPAAASQTGAEKFPPEAGSSPFETEAGEARTETEKFPPEAGEPSESEKPDAG